MKKVIVLFVLLTATYSFASAQCDKKYKLKTERIFGVKEDGSEGEDVPITADISISKDSILISLVLPDGNTAEINGKHTEKVCKMNADYTEGTIECKTDVEMSGSGETRQIKMSFTIECKAGKMKIFGVPDDQPNEKICFQIKEKEEVK
jgi:hypothetical protein